MVSTYACGLCASTNLDLVLLLCLEIPNARFLFSGEMNSIQEFINANANKVDQELGRPISTNSSKDESAEPTQNTNILRDIETLIGNMEQNQARQNEDMLKNIESLLGNILVKQSRPQSSTSNFSANSYDRINVKSPIPIKNAISVQQDQQSMDHDIKVFVSQHIQDIVPDLVVHVKQDLNDLNRHETSVDHYSASELEDTESEIDVPETIDNNEILNINRFLDKELDQAGRVSESIVQEAINSSEILNINRFLDKELDQTGVSESVIDNSEILRINKFLQAELERTTAELKQTLENRANQAAMINVAPVVMEPEPVQMIVINGQSKKEGDIPKITSNQENPFSSLVVESLPIKIEPTVHQNKQIPSSSQVNNLSTANHVMVESISAKIQPTVSQNKQTSSTLPEQSHVTPDSVQKVDTTIELASSTSSLNNEVDKRTKFDYKIKADKSAVTQNKEVAAPVIPITSPVNTNSSAAVTSASIEIHTTTAPVTTSSSAKINTVPTAINSNAATLLPAITSVPSSASPGEPIVKVDIESQKNNIVRTRTAKTNVPQLAIGKTKQKRPRPSAIHEQETNNQSKANVSKTDITSETTPAQEINHTAIIPQTLVPKTLLQDLVVESVSINNSDNNNSTEITAPSLATELINQVSKEPVKPLQNVHKVVLENDSVPNTTTKKPDNKNSTEVSGSNQKNRKRRQRQRERKQSLEIVSNPTLESSKLVAETPLPTFNSITPTEIEQINEIIEEPSNNLALILKPLKVVSETQSLAVNIVIPTEIVQSEEIIENFTTEQPQTETNKVEDIAHIDHFEVELSSESETEEISEPHLIVPEINIEDDHEDIDLPELQNEILLDNLISLQQEHRPSSALQMNLANDYIETEAIDTDSIEETLNNEIIPPVENITEIEMESSAPSDTEPDSFSDDSETEHESDPNETNESLMSESVIDNVTENVSEPKGQQNLSDLVSDTQKLIKQMRDEINSDIASFVSDDDAYSDYDESYSDEWTEDGEEYEEEEEYEDEDEDAIAEEENEGEWTETEDEYDSEYYEQEGEIDSKASVSQEVRSSQSIESEQFVEAQEQIDEVVNDSYSAILPPTEFLDNNEVVQEVTVDNISANALDSSQQAIVSPEIIIPTITTEAVESTVQPMEPNHPELLENIANIQKSLHITTTVLVERSLQGNREVLSPDLSASITPDRGSSISLNSIDQDSRMTPIQTDYVVITREVQSPDIPPITSDQGTSISKQDVFTDEVISETVAPILTKEVQSRYISLLPADNGNNTVEQDTNPETKIETQVIANDLVPETTNIIKEETVQIVQNNTASLSEVILANTTPITSSDTTSSASTSDSTVTTSNTTPSKASVPAAIVSETIGEPANDLPTLDTNLPTSTETNDSLYAVTSDPPEPETVKKPTTKVVKKIPVRKSSLPGPFGPLRTSNVKAMQQELLNKTVVKPQIVGTKPSKIVPPKVYSKPTKISSTLSDRITKFIKPFTNSGASGSGTSGAGTSSGAAASISASHQESKAVKREIPKKKYHETCFSDDYQTSDDEIEVTKTRQMPMRQQSMPNIMQSQLDEDETTEVSLTFLFYV